MFEIKYKSPEIKARSTGEADEILLTADIPKTVNLYQAQSMQVKTGLAIKSDMTVLAVPTKENNILGLVFGSGLEAVETDGEDIEITIWNRNVPGQQRMIEIKPGMVLGKLFVNPKGVIVGTKAAAPTDAVAGGSEETPKDPPVLKKKKTETA